jgi:hypothetical protein
MNVAVKIVSTSDIRSPSINTNRINLLRNADRNEPRCIVYTVLVSKNLYIFFRKLLIDKQFQPFNSPTQLCAIGSFYQQSTIENSRKPTVFRSIKQVIWRTQPGFRVNKSLKINET